jgi:hypothetical protein
MKTNKDFYEYYCNVNLSKAEDFETILDHKAQFFTDSIKLIFANTYGKNPKSERDLNKAFYHVFDFLIFASATKTETDCILACQDFFQSKYSSFQQNQSIVSADFYDFAHFLSDNISDYTRGTNS